MSEYKLCYISRDAAWFTTASLEDQTGDDWDDRPYDCNAGEPYVWYDQRGCPEYDLIKIYFDCSMQEPCDRTGTYSVDDINKGITAWLAPYWNDMGEVIHAGTSLEDFKEKIWQSGGKIYIEEKPQNED